MSTADDVAHIWAMNDRWNAGEPMRQPTNNRAAADEQWAEVYGLPLSRYKAAMQAIERGTP